ncbi:MAG: aryl-sulfate sulfotransferase [Candidatus Korobacteraceae bacterium]
MSKKFCVCLVLLLGLSLLPAFAAAAGRPPSVSITLNPSLPSPELLDTSILWTATISGGNPNDTYDYQFSAALQGQNQIVRDFDLPNSFTWVPWTVEGTYVVSVVVRDITQHIVYPAVSVNYVIHPIVTQNGQSAVNMTNHPLVALFSAGPCTVGHSIRVRFRQNGTQTYSATNSVPCSSTSNNFLIAGMAPVTQYQMHWEEFASGFDNSGSDLNFTTGHLPNNFPRDETFTVKVPATQHDAAFPINLFQLVPGTGQPFILWPAATDLNGNVLWYYPGQILITRQEAGGNFFAMDNLTLKEYDLAGNVTLATNVEILNEQLVAKGYPVMSSFNAHETRRLPDGGLLLLGARDEASTQYQGGTQQDPVDILGDMVLVLDHNMQLVWAWDSFAHEDLSRAATLGETCAHDSEGCPLFNPAFPFANDWLHSNAVQLTSDGNIVISQRDQDWYIKINYNNGHGDGSLIWRMGPFGDFTILNPPQTQCGDPAVFPWFTHQHDATFQTQIGAFETLTVFDDGNLRHTQCGNTGNSRGMMLQVSERARTVVIQLQADLGAYSGALGSAQLLSSPGNPLYASFGNGLLFVPQHAAQSTEVDIHGNIVYQLQANWWSYRTFRLQDLYTPPEP